MPAALLLVPLEASQPAGAEAPRASGGRSPWVGVLVSGGCLSELFLS